MASFSLKFYGKGQEKPFSFFLNKKPNQEAYAKQRLLYFEKKFAPIRAAYLVGKENGVVTTNIQIK